MMARRMVALVDGTAALVDDTNMVVVVVVSMVVMAAVVDGTQRLLMIPT
jgi:hypothetical protein